MFIGFFICLLARGDIVVVVGWHIAPMPVRPTREGSVIGGLVGGWTWGAAYRVNNAVRLLLLLLWWGRLLLLLGLLLWLLLLL